MQQSANKQSAIVLSRLARHAIEFFSLSTKTSLNGDNMQQHRAELHLSVLLLNLLWTWRLSISAHGENIFLEKGSLKENKRWVISLKVDTFESNVFQVRQLIFWMLNAYYKRDLNTVRRTGLSGHVISLEGKSVSRDMMTTMNNWRRRSCQWITKKSITFYWKFADFVAKMAVIETRSGFCCWETPAGESLLRRDAKTEVCKKGNRFTY